MEQLKEKKSEIRARANERLKALNDNEYKHKCKMIEARLYEFANFLEAKIALLYANRPREVLTDNIIRRSHAANKIVVLPIFNTSNYAVTLYKVDNLNTDLIKGPAGIKGPDPQHSKIVPIERIDIAIIPGIAFDTKGGRIGTGKGCYDRLIPKLPITTRKVALALECQFFTQIPMESHDKHVDIIITEDRIIYKI
jgi:5-formyltetrahydrofolate cyclo-ligase